MKTVGDVVKRVLNGMNSLLADNKETDFLVDLESSLFIEKLTKLLNDTTFAQSVLPINEVNLKDFYDILIERWNCIQSTDASYCHSPYSRVNRICMLLANTLATKTKSAYEILMPSLSCKNYHFPGRSDLSSLKLHEFLLDDNGDPIWVEQTLTMQCNDNKLENDPLSLLLCESPKNKLVKSLSWFENERVKNHSNDAKEYSRLMQSTGNVNETKKWFSKTFKKDDYNVTASYGEEGRKKLLRGILSSVKNAHDLASTLSHIPQDKWKTFFNGMKDEDLFSIVVGISCNDLKTKFPNTKEYKKNLLQKLDEALQQLLQQFLHKDFIPQNERQARALLFSLREVYERYRSEMPEYKTSPGRYFGFMLPNSSSYSKTDKLSSVEVFANFVLSDYPLDGLLNYLNANQLYAKHWGVLTYSSYASCISSYLAAPSTLSLLTSLAKDLGEKLKNPKNENENAIPKKKK